MPPRRPRRHRARAGKRRIALLGANGYGKSTFANLLAGQLAPLRGEAMRAPKLRVGYFAQHQIEALRPEDSALQHLARRLLDERAERLRARLVPLRQEKAAERELERRWLAAE